VRRATFAEPAATSSSSQAAVAGSAPIPAQSFVTPAVNRRRGNTDQSLDAEERMLLLTGSEMHNQSNQHDHLMRPPGAYSDGDDDDESEDDFDGVEEGDVEALQAAVGAGEVFHMHDEDEDEVILCALLWLFKLLRYSIIFNLITGCLVY
jgi:hypothetical protein